MTTIKVKGMMCQHCSRRVEEAIKSISGVEDVKLNLADGTVIISGDFDIDKVEDAIINEGYEMIQL
jgi:copper chaperone CopZ